jgi:hypothetical protein
MRTRVNRGKKSINILASLLLILPEVSAQESGYLGASRCQKKHKSFHLSESSARLRSSPILKMETKIQAKQTHHNY